MDNKGDTPETDDWTDLTKHFNQGLFGLIKWNISNCTLRILLTDKGHALKITLLGRLVDMDYLQSAGTSRLANKSSHKIPK